jgi:hypothetical protein
MDDIPAVVGVTLVFSLFVLLVGWIAWIVSRRSQERTRGKLELQRQTLQRFSSADELVAFTQTETGKRFMESLSTEHASHAQRILGSTRVGIVFVLVGVGLCILRLMKPELEPLMYFGVIGIMLGLGFLISAWASYRLAHKWGLMPPTV